MEKKYYTIYMTTNLINGNYYVGQHETTNLNDNYLGSGNNLKRAIKKHGKENFYKELLMVCSSRKEMNQIEGLVIDEYLVKDKRCYNLSEGGQGGNLGNYGRNIGEKNGMYGKTHTKEVRASIAKATGKRMKGVPKPEDQKKKMSKSMKGIRKSPEAIENIRKARLAYLSRTKE